MQTIEINKIPALTWNWMKVNKGSISDDFDFSEKEPAIQSNTNIQISKGVFYKSIYLLSHSTALT